MNQTFTLKKKKLLQEKRKDFLKAVKDFKSKQGTAKQTTKKVRLFAHTFNNISVSSLLTLLKYYASGSSSRPQIEIEQITIRFKESNKPLSQMPHGSTPQRKLLRLKDSPNKRYGMERVHTKSKARNSKNRQGVLRRNLSKIKRPTHIQGILTKR